MAAYGRSSLRDLYDESPTPHIAHPPRTHHRDFYLATDGSFRESGGGLGAVIETRDGTRVARRCLEDGPPDNNVAEYRALHLGLDLLAARASGEARVGVLVDHDDLAANVNAAVLSAADPTTEPQHPVSVPSGTGLHWRGILARIRGFETVKAARIPSDENPAHPLANAPAEYAHVNQETDRRGTPDRSTGGEQIPPPSRADRRASD
jgi:hypothetical protein